MTTTCSNCGRYCETRLESDGRLWLYGLDFATLLPTGERHACGEHDYIGSSYDSAPLR